MPKKPQSQPQAEIGARLTPDTVRCTVIIPKTIFTQYANQLNEDSFVETTLEKRLVKCVDHTDEKPLYFTDTERKELESLLGKNLTSAADALNILRKRVVVKVEGIEVPLSPKLLTRLQTRCFKKPFELFILELVTQELERYCGMR